MFFIKMFKQLLENSVFDSKYRVIKVHACVRVLLAI